MTNLMYGRLIQKTSIMKPNETIRQFLQYILVGVIATIVEWTCFYLFFQIIGMHHLLSTAIAFIFSTFANWLAGKLIMFKIWKNTFHEIIQIYLASVVGLLLNLFLMWIMVDQFSLMELLSKIIATGIVFIWNFLIRKLVIYK